MAHIKDFNLITQTDLHKLEEAGIHTCSQLLEKASTSIERMNLADRLNMDDLDLRELAHRCDIMRIPGMTPKLANLLCTIGVSTVPKFAYQSASNLLGKIADKGGPTVDRQLLERLIASAKRLPKIIRH